jgi:hypothetical protein
VEALRTDRWVRQRGAPVEIEKQDLEKSTYQHPERYGQPAEMGIHYAPEPRRAAEGEAEAAPTPARQGTDQSGER